MKDTLIMSDTVAKLNLSNQQVLIKACRSGRLDLLELCFSNDAIARHTLLASSAASSLSSSSPSSSFVVEPALFSSFSFSKWWNSLFPSAEDIRNDELRSQLIDINRPCDIEFCTPFAFALRSNHAAFVQKLLSLSRHPPIIRLQGQDLVKSVLGVCCRFRVNAELMELVISIILPFVEPISSFANASSECIYLYTAAELTTCFGWAFTQRCHDAAIALLRHFPQHLNLAWRFTDPFDFLSNTYPLERERVLGFNALHFACLYQWDDLIRALLDEPRGRQLVTANDDNGLPPLALLNRTFIERVPMDLLEESLQMVSTNGSGRTILHLICDQHIAGHEFLQALLERLPPDSEALRLMIDLPDDQGNTPLMICTQKVHKASAKLLLDAGAEINFQNHVGNSAINLLKYNIQISRTMMQTLLEQSIFAPDVNLQNNQGNSIFFRLHRSDIDNFDALVHFLKARDISIDLELCNNEGDSIAQVFKSFTEDVENPWKKTNGKTLRVFD